MHAYIYIQVNTIYCDVAIGLVLVRMEDVLIRHLASGCTTHYMAGHLTPETQVWLSNSSSHGASGPYCHSQWGGTVHLPTSLTTLPPIHLWMHQSPTGMVWCSQQTQIWELSCMPVSTLQNFPIHPW